MKSKIVTKDITDSGIKSGDYIEISYNKKSYPAKVISKTNDSIEYEITGYGFYKHGIKMIPNSRQSKILNSVSVEDITDIDENKNVKSISIEEAFKALYENNEASLPSSDAEYYLVIANELAFDLEFYAKLVNREELVSEIIRYIELDRFDTSADILLELPEAEFEKAIEDLCMAAAGEAYLEDVGILIKNKAGKVISGIDFTLSLIDELQDYEAGNDVIQKLKNQQPFTFTFERDINDYGDFVVESDVSVDEAFRLLKTSDVELYESGSRKGQGYRWKNNGIGKTYGFNESEYVVHHINGDPEFDIDPETGESNLALIPSTVHNKFKKDNRGEWEKIEKDFDISNVVEVDGVKFILALPKTAADKSVTNKEKELLTV